MSTINYKLKFVQTLENIRERNKEKLLQNKYGNEFIFNAFKSKEKYGIVWNGGPFKCFLENVLNYREM